MSETPRDPAPEGAPPQTDPLKSLRSIFAAVLVLEAIAVLLALLVVDRFTQGSVTPVGITLVAVLGALMVLGSGVQRRPWGLGFALVLQVALLACGFVHVSLVVIGILFGLVWGALLWMRHDVAGRMARGELPSQQR